VGADGGDFLVYAVQDFGFVARSARRFSNVEQRLDRLFEAETAASLGN